VREEKKETKYRKIKRKRERMEREMIRRRRL
jgi:hypothetical protein